MKTVSKPRRSGSPRGARRHPRDPHLAALIRTNHDLRSPLSVILGVFELLQDNAGLGESERRYVTLGSDAAAELLSQADALRLYSAMARERITLEPVPVDLDALARERLQPALERRNVRLAATAGASHRVQGDPGYLGVALGGLARHLAAHLQEPGDGEALQLRMQVADKDAATVTLSVHRADTPEAPSTLETLEPGEVDLAVVNAVQLIELMQGRVAMNAEQPYLHVELPAASA